MCTKERGQLLEPGKGKERFSSEPPEAIGYADLLILGLLTPRNAR